LQAQAGFFGSMAGGKSARQPAIGHWLGDEDFVSDAMRFGKSMDKASFH
jgi:hypothetical protein